MSAYPNATNNNPTPPQVWITTNSPGELSSWVVPLVALLRESRPTAEVVIALVPCQYASGNEVKIALSIPGVSRVLKPKETIRYLLRPQLGRRRVSGVVLYLGGDPLYAKLIGRKHRWPVVAYTEHQYSLGIGVTTVLRKSVVGDLMASRIAMRESVDQKIDYDIVFFSGSRPAHFDLFAPFCAEISRELLKRNPSLKIAIQRSLFIDDRRWQQFVANCNGLAVHLNEGSSLDILASSQLLVSLPGTSTAEAMYMGTPMVVLVPLNRPDLIQLDGLLGLVGAIPLLGTALKRLALYWMQKNPKPVALPNRIVGRRIVPEIVDVLTVEKTTDDILNYLNNPEGRAMQQAAFLDYPATNRAAVAIIDELKRWI